MSYTFSFCMNNPKKKKKKKNINKCKACEPHMTFGHIFSKLGKQFCFYTSYFVSYPGWKCIEDHLYHENSVFTKHCKTIYCHSFWDSVTLLSFMLINFQRISSLGNSDIIYLDNLFLSIFYKLSFCYTRVYFLRRIPKIWWIMFRNDHKWILLWIPTTVLKRLWCLQVTDMLIVLASALTVIFKL